MSIIAWIVVGLIAGWLASLVVKTRGGLVMDLVLGVIGGIVGGWLAGLLLNRDTLTGINIESIITAFVGAVILVLIVRALPGRSPV